LKSPCSEIHRGVILGFDVTNVVFVGACNIRLEIVPSGLGKRSFDAGVPFVNNEVPDSMELISTIVVRQLERIGTFVTIRVFVIDASDVVKRLSNITGIVDQKTESEGFGDIFVTRVQLHQVGVHVFLLITLIRRISDPVGNNPQGVSDVFGSVGECKVVERTTLIKPDVVLEVVISLPSVTVIFDVIGKSGTFDKRMVNFTVDKVGIVLLQGFKHVKSLLV